MLFLLHALFFIIRVGRIMPLNRLASKCLIRRNMPAPRPKPGHLPGYEHDKSLRMSGALYNHRPPFMGRGVYFGSIRAVRYVACQGVVSLMRASDLFHFIDVPAILSII